jgi:hypothetical protein
MSLGAFLSQHRAQRLVALKQRQKRSAQALHV